MTNNPDTSRRDFGQTSDREILTTILETVSEDEKNKPAMKALAWGLNELLTTHGDKFQLVGAERLLQRIAIIIPRLPGQLKSEGDLLLSRIKLGGGEFVSDVIVKAIAEDEKISGEVATIESVSALSLELVRTAQAILDKLPRQISKE